jgi:hypothetical protein
VVETISAVTLRVANMRASVRFYKDVLGLEIIYGNGVITSRAIMNYQENESEKQRSRCNYYSDYDSTMGALQSELESDRRNTDNSKHGKRDLADILPAWIFCPQRSRSPVTQIRFENCEVESDLPERFIFVQLVPGSFKQLPTGFSARYASSYIDTVVSGAEIGSRIGF